MKNSFIPIVAVSGMLLICGCAWEIGGGAKHATIQPTLGQQLTDLQKAKEAGAITDSEFQAQKQKLLGIK